MFTLLAAVLLGQIPTPLPRYDPAGYRRAHPEYIWPSGPQVGPSRTINLQYPKPTGRVLSQDKAKCLLKVKLDDGEIVLVHYGPTTLFRGYGGRVEIDKPNRILTFTK